MDLRLHLLFPLSIFSSSMYGRVSVLLRNVFIYASRSTGFSSIGNLAFGNGLGGLTMLELSLYYILLCSLVLRQLDRSYSIASHILIATKSYRH